MYYNTTNEKGADLKQHIIKTETQEAVILRLYKQHKKLSASEVWRMFDMPGTPLTSCRRAITNLMNDGKLIKTDEKIEGLYGSPEYRYELKFKETLF